MHYAAYPGEVGIRSEGVLGFLDGVKEKGIDVHSFVLVRHGRIAAEGAWYPYRQDVPHVMYSLSKSFTSTAAGLLIGEGKLNLDDRVIDLFPKEAPKEPDAFWQALRVRHLLSMSTGHEKDPAEKFDKAKNWVKLFFSEPLTKEPGTHFLYNNSATYMVSAIVQSVTGLTVRDYLVPRLFAPLGIDTPNWDVCPMGRSAGAFGLHLTAREIAKFGQLLLQKGLWEGRQLLPIGWVDNASSIHIVNGNDANSDWAQGYGFQFWRCRPNAFRGDGAFGQFCIVIPEQDAVYAGTSGTDDMQGVMNLVWEHLLPAFEAGELPPNPEQDARLKDALAALQINPRLPVMQQEPGSAQAPLQVQTVKAPSTQKAMRIMGTAAFIDRTWAIEKNKFGVARFQLQVFPQGQMRKDRLVLTVIDNMGVHAITAGIGYWQEGETQLNRSVYPGTWPERIAAIGTQTAHNEWQVRIQFTESSMAIHVTLTEEDNQLNVAFRYIAAFMPPVAPLKGLLIPNE